MIRALTVTVCLLVCLNINTIKGQITDINGCSLIASDEISNISAEQNTLIQNLLVPYNIRALTEINKTDTAEAYPYLSPDALRLYFAQGIAGSSSLNYVSRSNTSSYFGNKQIVSSVFPANQAKGCWLTNDELEIFFVDNDVLYYSNRSSLSSPFSVPTTITLLGNPITTIYSPSLSPDKQELYLTASSSSKSIIRFHKTGATQYNLTDTLQIPANYSAGPGQLSKDGLKFVVALFISAENRTKLFQYSRSSLTTTFNTSSLVLLDASLNNTSYSSNNQPSISADGNIIVWVRNACGIVWIDNDLFIGMNLTTGEEDSDLKLFPSIYPNPAKDIINIDGEFNSSDEVSIYNQVGQLIHQQNLIHESNQIDAGSFPDGIYIIKIKGDNNFIYKLIKE
jgi:hypothetical protein